MSEIRQAVDDAKKPSIFLPLMGLIMAICCGVIAYFSAPIVLDTLIENVDSFEAVPNDDTPELEEQILINNQQFSRRQAELAATATVAIILFSFLMTFVSILGGRTGLKERQEILTPPKPGKGTNKQWEKYERKLAKQRKEKIEALKRIKAKKEAAERKKK